MWCTEVTDAEKVWQLNVTLPFQLEQQMDVLHKQRATHFKKTMDVSIKKRKVNYYKLDVK